MKHISLFSGINAAGLAAEWMGWENIVWCEINKFCQIILKYYWPNAKGYEDIRKTDFSIYRGANVILTGGFPCQGFSLAGQRLGTDDDRYLWPEMLRAIRESQPDAIVAENVTGILSMEDKSGIWSEVFPRMESRKITRYDSVDKYEAIYTRQAKMLISTICEDLEKEGYSVQPFVIPAAGIGAPHKRERIWIVAYRCSKQINIPIQQRGQIKTKNINASRKSSGRDASNSTSIRMEGNRTTRKQKPQSWSRSALPGCNSTRNDWSDWPTQSPLCSGDDGLSSRLDGITFPKWRNESIKALGNAQVPQINYEIFKAIQTIIKQ